MGHIRASAPDPSFALSHPLTRYLPSGLRGIAQNLLLPPAPTQPTPPTLSPPPLPQPSPPPAAPVTPTGNPPISSKPPQRVAEVSLPPSSSTLTRPRPRARRLLSEEPLDIDNLVLRPPLSSAPRALDRLVEVFAKVRGHSLNV